MDNAHFNVGTHINVDAQNLRNSGRDAADLYVEYVGGSYKKFAQAVQQLCRTMYDEAILHVYNYMDAGNNTFGCDHMLINVGYMDAGVIWVMDDCWF